MFVVQCDFDDTITVGNVGVMILQAFGPDQWVQMEEEYHAGKYSVEESNIRQYALIKASREEIENLVALKVAVREGFDDFVDYCAREALKLVVVSSGLDVYIGPVLERVGLGHLEVHSGKAKFASSGIMVEYTDPSRSVITRGYKASVLREMKRNGYKVIYVGDGFSDIEPAMEADFIIARSTLESRLRADGVPCHSFETFRDVCRHVDGIRRDL